MSGQPSKYNREYQKPITRKSGIRIVVRFDKPRQRVTRFIVQLQRLTNVFESTWETFAQIDHEPANPQGHDLYREGIHVDVYHHNGQRSKIKSVPTHASLPRPPIVLLHACKDYLIAYVDYWEHVAANPSHLGSSPPFNP